MTDEQQEVRLAENEVIFRDANEQIEGRADELDFSAPVPFLCECGDRGCHEIVRLTREEYAEIRTNPRHFVIVPEHVDVAILAGKVVAPGDKHVIVEKTGLAGEIAEDRKPVSGERG